MFALMRRLILLVVVLAASGATASAQRSGLLLGFSSDSGYRTLWIAAVGGKVVATSVAPTLIVPRPDGFHHLDIVHRCGITETGEGGFGGPFRDEIDELVDQPLGAPPARDTINRYRACDATDSVIAVMRDSIARADSIALLTAKTEQDSLAHAPRLSETDETDETDVCGFQIVRITHAGSAVWSTFSRSGTTEFCNPGRYTSSEHRYTQLADGTEASLLRYLSPSRARAVTRVWEREKGECAFQSSPDESWGIERAFGEWRAAFATSGATACRGESGNEDNAFSIVQRVPPALARREPVQQWLSQLKVLSPALTDAFVSPLNDVVVALVGDRLSVFTPIARKLGAPVLTIDLRKGETVVMAEWATGAHVARWTRELSAVHERW